MRQLLTQWRRSSVFLISNRSLRQKGADNGVRKSLHISYLLSRPALFCITLRIAACTILCQLHHRSYLRRSDHKQGLEKDKVYYYNKFTRLYSRFYSNICHVWGVSNFHRAYTAELSGYCTDGWRCTDSPFWSLYYGNTQAQLSYN